MSVVQLNIITSILQEHASSARCAMMLMILSTSVSVWQGLMLPFSQYIMCLETCRGSVPSDSPSMLGHRAGIRLPMLGMPNAPVALVTHVI